MGNYDHWYPKGTLTEPFVPQDISDAMSVFPAGIAHLMPPVDSIPDDFADPNNHDNIWRKLFSDWFFNGLKSLDLTPKENIDPNKAARHIRAIMGSWEPKHEYKTAAVSYLLSLWFDNPKWEIKDS
jgi:hypothetical protein